MVRERVVRGIGCVCHIATAQRKEGDRGGRLGVCQTLSGRDCQALSGGDCLSGPFGGRLPGEARCGLGDFWGSEVGRSKRK